MLILSSCLKNMQSGYNYTTNVKDLVKCTFVFFQFFFFHSLIRKTNLLCSWVKTSHLVIVCNVYALMTATNSKSKQNKHTKTHLLFILLTKESIIFFSVLFFFGRIKLTAVCHSSFGCLLLLLLFRFSLNPMSYYT